MKPNEFWNSTYREAYQYVKANAEKETFDHKQNIVLYDALGSKILSGIAKKKPKNISLVKEVFKDLFEEELKPSQQTIEEQVRILRSMK